MDSESDEVVTKTHEILRQLESNPPDKKGRIKARVEVDGKVLMWMKDKDGNVKQLR